MTSDQTQISAEDLGIDLDWDIPKTRIHRIREFIESGTAPHLGAETEGIATDANTLEVVHRIGGVQTTQALKNTLGAMLRPHDADPRGSITTDIPETTVEANPPPLSHPRSTAASQRLLAIILDSACQQASRERAFDLQLLNGAAWRPPHSTPADAPESHPSLFKRLYYEAQLTEYDRDQMASAAGDHLNLSLPWKDWNAHETSEFMIQMTGRMRLIAGAISIALSASSPLYFGSNDRNHGAEYHTILTPYQSARLGKVWPGRTVMDVSSLYNSHSNFLRTLKRFARNGILRSGRDIYLPVRAQPDQRALTNPTQSFEDLCCQLGLDPSQPENLSTIRRHLFHLFNLSTSLGAGDVIPAVKAEMERWRQDMLLGMITAPRNRVELRTLETPFAFETMTPYRYLKAIHTFFELLFVYLSEHPPFVQGLEYGELELQAAKDNEFFALQSGLDAAMHWIPKKGMPKVPMRGVIDILCRQLRPLAAALGREEGLELIQSVVSHDVLAPANKIRAEISTWYGMAIRSNDNYDRALPDEGYPRELLGRSRRMMTQELAEMEQDLPVVPPNDRKYLEPLLRLAKRLHR